MSLATTDSLIWASVEQLVHPLLVRGARDDQIGPVAGEVAQPADLRWRHEAGPNHAPLGDLGQPGGVQLVRLGPAR
jgi:hypothetical protein